MKSLTSAKPEAQQVQLVINFLSQYHPIPPEIRSELETAFFPVSYKEGEYILAQGETCTALYFILKGAVAGQTLHHKKRLTSFICSEGDCVSSITGMYGQKPSGESILALEDVSLLAISVDKFVALLETSIEINIIIRKILEEFYKSAHERSNIVRLGTAKEKYDYYAAEAPDLINRIPTTYIAEYLDINHQTLERILKKRLVKDDLLNQERRQLIEEFLIQKEGFKQKDLTITKLSAALSIPVHQLSRLINTSYKKSFSSFINGHRITYVLNQLTNYSQWQHLKIEALGAESGFSSRSVFFEKFKQHTGLSPIEYLKTVQQSSPTL